MSFGENEAYGAFWWQREEIMTTDKVKITYETLQIPREEAEEMFRIVRNIVDDLYFCRKPKKEWPLYDRLASFLGENDLQTHYLVLEERREDPDVDYF